MISDLRYKLAAMPPKKPDDTKGTDGGSGSDGGQGDPPPSPPFAP